MRILVVDEEIPYAINSNHNTGQPGRPNLKRQELGFTPVDFLIATAGRLSLEKGQRDLIAAYSNIQSKYPGARLLLLGDGPLRGKLKALIAERHIQNVHFLGFRRDIDEIMAAIDLFALPSLTEGLPNVILEAFAFAQPVVATAVDGVPEVVEDGVNGILVPPKRPDLLANALDKCLSSPKMAQQM